MSLSHMISSIAVTSGVSQESSSLLHPGADSDTEELCVGCICTVDTDLTVGTRKVNG